MIIAFGELIIFAGTSWKPLLLVINDEPEPRLITC
jgi:hypothetical protein